MELNKFHVLQTKACTGHHAMTVTGTGMGRGAAKECTAITARCQNDHLGVETVHFTAIKVPCHQPAARAVIIHDQIKGNIFDKELGFMLQALLIQGMEHRVTGTVSRGTGPFNRRLTVITGVTTKRALVDFAIFGARKRHAVMFKFMNSRHRIAAHIFDCVLITQPV